MGDNGENRRRSIDSEIGQLIGKVDDLHKGVGKALSHANDAHVTCAKTLAVVEGLNTRLDEDRASHTAMWRQINDHSAFQNNWKGFMAGVVFIASGVGAMIVVVINYLLGHLKI